MAHIRDWTEVEALAPTAAERAVIEAAKAGAQCVLGVGICPPEGEAPQDVAVRAEILRYLILGGCDTCSVDDIGVWLKGAYVTGPLDLDFTHAKGAIQLEACRFDHQIEMRQTRCASLALTGSALRGIAAEAMRVEGTISLASTTTDNTVHLRDATIGGQMLCNGATFVVGTRRALNLQGARIAGHVNLSSFFANATVLVSGAEIQGQLNCADSQFSDETDFAFDAQSTSARHGIIWRNVTVPKGNLRLAYAQFSVLSDTVASYPTGGRTIVQGMTYDSIAGGPTDAKTRLKWLENCSLWDGDFYPQPYTQLARVLRGMGHDSDARSVLLDRDRRLGPPNRKRLLQEARTLPARIWQYGTHPLRWFVDQMFRLVAGYGHRPFRSVMVLALLIMLTIIPAHYAWEEGSLAPNSGVLLNSENWRALANEEDNPAKVWSGDIAPQGWDDTRDGAWHQNAPGRDWETFNRYAYGIDVVIPIINFGQTDAWAPSTTRGPFGKVLWWARWLLSVAGWIVTALGAAAITGLIRRE